MAFGPFKKKEAEEPAATASPLERLKELAEEAGPAKCSAAAAGGLLLLWALRKLAGGIKAARERRAADRLSSAVTVMLSESAAGSNVVLAAEKPEESGGKLPETLCSHLLLVTTAFDPLGEKKRTLEANAAANARMWASIQAMEPAPAKVWPCFGYSLADGWREDGFCLAFLVPGGEEEADAARAAVAAMAREFGQGAMFEYVKGEEEDSLVCTMVPVKMGPAAAKEVTLWRVPECSTGPHMCCCGEKEEGEEEGEGEPPSPLVTRPWAGPEEVLSAAIAIEPAPRAVDSFKPVEQVLAQKDKDSARQRRWWSRHKVGALSPIRNLFP